MNAAPPRFAPPDPASEYLFNELLDSVYEAILITDAQGHILRTNIQAVTFFGQDRERLLKCNVRELIYGLNEITFQQIVLALKDHRHILLDADCARTENKTFPAEVAVHRIYLTATPFLCFSIRDLSTRIEAEKRQTSLLERTLTEEKVRARLLTVNTLADEIQTPIDSLLADAESAHKATLVDFLRRLSAAMEALRNHAPLPETASSAGPRYTLDIRPAQPGQTPRILIADDEIAIRQVFSNALRAEFPDLEIDLAFNGRDAVETFGKGHHAVIILDIAMPIMNGEEAFFRIQRLCRDNRWPMPSVIFCTGFTPPESILEVVRTEKNHCYQPKPVPIETLVSTIRDCLAMRKA